ncbi:hypothetical protein AALD74_12185 [Lachnospiraceae bacterium 48-21]
MIDKPIKRIPYTLSTDVAKTTAWGTVKSLVGIFQKDPVAAFELLSSIKGNTLSLTDQIFIENLQAFLFHLNEVDVDKQTYLEDGMKRFSEALADASPNVEAGYGGNQKKLHEYGKRILKAIDDCGTEQKALFLANISRALANHIISKKEYFKFIQCIRMLTEEDLEFISQNISDKTITTDEDYIDDFRALGLMKEVEDGFVYTERAFQFVNAAIRYESPVDVPEHIAQRNIMQMPPISPDSIEKLFDNMPEDVENRIAEKVAPKWQNFGSIATFGEPDPVIRGQNLNHDAMILVAYTSKDPLGQIMVLRDPSGTCVSTCEGNFVKNELNGREAARWEDAVNQLLSYDFIKLVGKKDKIYQLTDDGYKVADAVIETNGIDVEKSPDEYLDDDIIPIK